MPELVCILTSTRQVILANQAMGVFLGKGGGELIPGSRPGELVQCAHTDCGMHACGTTSYCNQCGAFRTIMSSIGRNEKATGECRVTQNLDGKMESLDLYLWCSPVQVESHTLYVLAIINISDQKRRQALERIFFHDLLNSFSALISHVQLLQTAPVDQVHVLANRLSTATDSLVQEVLAQRDLLLAESDQLIVNPSLIHPTQLLQRVVEGFDSDPLLRDRLLQIAPQSQRAGLISDGVLLRRILVNMAKNGLEASQPGEMVSMGWELEDDNVRFWVHNPQVISPEHQLQIFNRSFSTKGSGRGLGTYSMRLLSERYLEGQVGFSSEQDKGTRFWVSLPLKPSYFPSRN
jgi:signal transduction histidine kinase